MTHAVDFIEKADRIVIMEGGKMKYMGTYEELQHSDEIQHIMETIAKTAIEEDKEDDLGSTEEPVNDNSTNYSKSHLSESGTQIMDDEHMEINEVPWNLYLKFFFNDKNWIAYVLLIPFFFAYSYFIVYSYIHYGKWATNSKNESRFWNDFMLAIGHPLGFATSIFIIILIVIFSTLRKTKKLQENMFSKTMNAPINLYFDKTPHGKILNRFSNDINKLDTEFPR